MRKLISHNIKEWGGGREEQEGADPNSSQFLEMWAQCGHTGAKRLCTVSWVLSVDN